MLEMLLTDTMLLSAVTGSTIAIGFTVLSGVAIVLRRQNKNMERLQAGLMSMQRDFQDFKASMIDESKIERHLSREQTQQKFDAMCEQFIQLENRIFDTETSKQSGHRVNEAIRLAQLQTSPEVIAQQTGVPMDMAKAISKFHVS